MPSSKTLYITEIFTSIQGETSFVGEVCTFVRLSGCNLRCSWCDTPYSFSKGDAFSIEELMKDIRSRPGSFVCITGGEPLLQKNVFNLIHQLCEENFTVSIETGGSLDIAPIHPKAHTIYDIKCPGSKMEHKNLWSNLDLLKERDEVKFVVKDQTDYEWAKGICSKYRLFERVSSVLFSPVFDALDARELVEWILQDRLPVRLNLQIHKFIWSPTTQGV